LRKGTGYFQGSCTKRKRGEMIEEKEGTPREAKRTLGRTKGQRGKVFKKEQTSTPIVREIPSSLTNKKLEKSEKGGELGGGGSSTNRKDLAKEEF